MRNLSVRERERKLDGVMRKLKFNYISEMPLNSCPKSQTGHR